jgi:hypothetical protein
MIVDRAYSPGFSASNRSVAGGPTQKARFAQLPRMEIGQKWLLR